MAHSEQKKKDTAPAVDSANDLTFEQADCKFLYEKEYRRIL
jgi:hypothetical protein